MRHYQIYQDHPEAVADMIERQIGHTMYSLTVMVWDPSGSPLIEVVRKRAAHTLAGPARPEFKTGIFDIIVLRDVITRASDYEAYGIIQKYHEYLRPEGHLVFDYYNIFHPSFNPLELKSVKIKPQDGASLVYVGLHTIGYKIASRIETTTPKPWIVMQK